MTLVSLSISKLIYTEPLIMEISLWLIMGYGLEVFNHSEVYYKFSLKNPVVKTLSRLYGDRGAYHIMHHSAYDKDIMVNLSEGPFNVWDRIFGTYKEPYKELPEVGLVNSPEVKLNPLRIVLGGWMQVFYELRHNLSLSQWALILFGPPSYTPPRSKDYLLEIQTRLELVYSRSRLEMKAA
jgi:hypothetical protein